MNIHLLTLEFFINYSEDGSDTELSYELFTGFDNLRDTDGDGFGDTIINVGGNTGRADAFMLASAFDQFKEYQFSVDDLDDLQDFKIKIVCGGANEAFAPRFKDFRTIALA